MRSRSRRCAPLRSIRVVLDESGALVRYHDYQPFGEEWHPAGWQPEVPRQDKRLFTGKERDEGTGLDYFGARYLASGTGRFTTIDPVYTWKENLVDPQRWNRYVYVRNRPLVLIDPDGRDAVWMTVGSKVVVLIPVRFTGKGVTPELISGVAAHVGRLEHGLPHVTIKLVSTDKRCPESSIPSMSALALQAAVPEARVQPV